MGLLSNEATVDEPIVRAKCAAVSGTWDESFAQRYEEHFPELHALFYELYGNREDGLETLVDVVALAALSWESRPDELKALDAARKDDPTWFASEKMIGGVCYVDRYAGSIPQMAEHIDYFKELGLTYLHMMPLFLAPEGDNDGGYAVSSYREVNPKLGSMNDLQELCSELRNAGISPVLDFVFNHTSSEHEWARKAVIGEPGYEDFYLIFPDRAMPDQYERTTREIFPDDHSGSFIQLPDGRWVWSTFYHFQWDLNYANPAVFCAMAGEMLFLANLGVEVLRMDAVAFIWKQLGTACESLPEAHLLLRAFNQVLAMAAPSVLFKSEAIVHPDEVIEYISPDECQVSYNPLQMALTWEALATRDASLLSQALSERHELPANTAWVNYVRSHDDIGWTFADEDAARLGINGFDHRRFLNDFYVGRFPRSFAAGVPFQENPKTGDARVAGTAAALSGIEKGDPGGEDRLALAYALAMSTGGMPLLYLGDEVAQLNDHYYRNDPHHADDSRWVHRPRRPAAAYGAQYIENTPSGRVFAQFQRMLKARKETPAFAGNDLTPFNAHDKALLAFIRPGQTFEDEPVLVIANFADEERRISALTLSGLKPNARNLITGEDTLLSSGLTVRQHSFVWLAVQLA